MKKLLLTFILSLSALAGYSQRVFMTGDSHVAGKYYPLEIQEILEREKPDVTFSYWGKNGADVYTFNESEEMMEHIFEADPDILIVHLGTNGSYVRNFDAQKHLADLTTFQGNIQGEMPRCKIVYVTPFLNKFRQKTGSTYTGSKKKGTRRKKTLYGPWKLNTNTRECADVIIEFAKKYPNTFVIDNNADAGDVFVDDTALIRPDFVHLTAEGYKLLGQQVAEKLLEIPQLWDEIPQE